MQEGKKGSEVQGRVLTGKASAESLRYADKNDVSLIGMARRDSSGQGPLCLRSVADKILHATKQSVLLIREPASGSALRRKHLVRRIAIPLDGSRVAEISIPAAEVLAPSAIKYLENTAQPLIKKGHAISRVVVIGSPGDQIIDYAVSNGIDLICMASHGWTGITRWAFGSTTDKVLHAGSVPVLGR